MSFIWNWIKKQPTLQEEFLAYETTKKILKTSLVKSINEGHLEEVAEYLKERDLFLEIVKELNPSECFEKQETSWKRIFEHYSKDNIVIINLLCIFSEQLLNVDWKKDWAEFVSGRNINHPYNLYIDYIRELFETKKYDSLEKRFDFHQFWVKPIPFSNFLKENCNRKEKTLHVAFTPSELERKKSELKKTIQLKKERKNQLLDDIKHIKTKLRSFKQD